MRGFYRNIKHLLCAIFVFCTVAFASNFANAEYVCDSKIIYDSCESGYYMTYSGSYNGTPRAGNECTKCPSNAVRCDGNTERPVYRVTLNHQGGTSTVSTFNSTTTCYMPASSGFGYCMTGVAVPTRTGYTFGGYYTATNGSGTKIINADGSFVSSTPTVGINGPVTLYAKWTPATYTITLDSKYYATSSTTTGTAVTTNAAPTPIYVKYNSNWYTNNSTTVYFVKLSTLPVYTGYTFGGFYTGKAGTGNQIIDASGNIVNGYTTAFTKNTTLYAKWNPICNKITIVDDGINSGATIGYLYKLTGLSKYYSDSSCSTKITSIKVPMASKALFTGLYTDRVGDDIVQCADSNGVLITSASCNISGETTWYARFDCLPGYGVTAEDMISYYCEPNNFVISYNANGGTGTMSNQSFTYDVAKNLLANTFTRTGYAFTGWNTAADGSGTSYADKASVKNLATGGTVTLYAKWTPNTVKVTLNNQSATTAGTTVYYYPYNTYNGSCYYFSNSSLTTCLAGATGGTKITVPTKTGYTFGGYYTGANGTGTQYVNASGATVNNIYKAVSSDITLYAKWTIISVKCPAGTYLKAGGTTTSDCVKCPKATTYSGAYCPGGTFSYDSTKAQGLNACPVLNDSTRMQSSSYPNNDDGGAATMISSNISAWFEGQDDISDCMVSYTFSNSAGNFTLEGTHYNSSTGRYDNGGGKYYTTLQPGYYLTTKYSDTYCDTSVSNYATRKKLYRIAKKCSAGSYCPGYASAMPLCSSTNETYGTNMGINTCPTTGANGRTVTSPAGSSAATSCYVTCPTKTVSNGTVTTVNSTINYSGSTYAACTYNTSCNAGYYGADNTSSPSCSACTGATYSGANASSCTPCPDGYTYNTTSGKTSAGACQIQCPAGTMIETVRGKCTTPSGGWWASGSRIASYGNFVQVNYCMDGYTNSGTSTTNHDAQSDCTKSVSGASVSTTIPARYIRLKTAGNTVNDYTQVVEIQAFASSNGTGTNLLSGKGSTDNLKKATDGTFTQSVYATTLADAYLTWDMGSEQKIGSIKFAMYSADARTYKDVQIEVSADGSNWTTVLGPRNIHTPKANGTDANPELLVLAGQTECSAGTYAQYTPVSLGSTKSCSTCPTNSSSTAGATSCTCNDGYNYNSSTTTTTEACSANTYTVSYKCFGPPFMSGSLAAYNNSFTLSVPSSCVKAGYTLTGWTTTDDDGNTIEYGPTDTFVWKYLADKTFNAVWTPICYPLEVAVADGADKQTYHTLYQRADDLYSLYNTDNCEDGTNVNMDAYMGSMPNAKEVPVGFYDVLTYELCVDENLEFTGNCVVGEGSEWFTKYQCKDGYWSYEYDEQFSYPGDSCDPLYYKITLDMNGGDANGAPGQIYEKPNDGWYVDGEKIDNIGRLPIKDKSVFNGFFTEQNGTGTQVIASDGRIIAPNFLFDSDKTIYAYYTKCECTPGDGVSVCSVMGTASENSCLMNIKCESGYSDSGNDTNNGGRIEYVAYGKPGVAKYTATCKKIGLTTGYNCPADSTRYISCFAGNYMATMDALGNYEYNGKPTSDNSCQPCPADAAYCPGGTSAPLYYVTFRDDIKESMVGNGLYANVNGEYYRYHEEEYARLERLPDENYPVKHTGLTFNGYWTQSQGGEQYIDANGNFLKGPSANIGLHAQWTQCAAGTYEQDGVCVTCPKGSYCANGIKNSCSEGTYADKEGMSECTSCPSNSSSEAGATECTCNDGYMMVDGACVEPEFTITTTDMAAESTFSFEISAKGTFYVDFDDGRGVQKIEKPNTTNTPYTSAAYANAGTHTIKMYGDATGYSTSYNTAAISFNGNKNIKSVDGSLGSIFGGSATYMFYSTFSGCTSLQSIPETLFSGVTGSANSMFLSTFSGCTSLQSIPETLFSGVTGSAQSMFRFTFNGCTSLQSIPETLFSGVTGSATYMFYSTFSGCTSLQSIPETLFSGVTGSAKSMFDSTFVNCTSLQSIPETLFSGVTGSAQSMFNSTFFNCTSLTSLPNGLFKNIEGKPLSKMFDHTFYNCPKLTGYIPANTFEKMDSTDFDSATMRAIFTYTALDTQCPAGMYQYITGFESAWNGKVSCVPCPSNSSSTAGATECTCNTGYNHNGATTTTTNACVASQYTVTFDANDGTGSMATQTFTYGEPQNLTANAFARTGYTFNGWNTAANGSGTAYADKAPISNLLNNITLYAQWEQCPAGTFEQDGVCVTCPKGSYCANGIKNSCSEGTYADKEGMSECTACPSNSSSEAGATSCTCNAGYMMVDGACVEPEFTITTIDMAAESTFSFEISASGTFYVDFDDGRGVQKIEKPNTTNTPYSSAAYANAGTHTIKMYGDATGYRTSYNTAAISFNGNKNIKSVDGSLGSIFGGSARSYMFDSTFNGCTSLQSIPETLFSGVTGSAIYMFDSTFNGCTSLQSIPENLFSGVTGSVAGMFSSTFRGCTSLQSIPETLFSGVTGSADGMFGYTFTGCTSLQSIPETLFSGVTGSADRMFNATFNGCTSLQSIPETLFSGVTDSAYGMFGSTFSGCTSLQSIPETLFSGVTGSAHSMFFSTFSGCTSLQSIPETLFSGVTGSADAMFYATFQGCKSLTSLPNGLFKNIEGKPLSNMFSTTFNNCSKLTGYIPANTFEKMDSTDFDSATMRAIFTYTALDTQCPAGMYQYITGFESAWDGKVSCTPCPSNSSSTAGATECTCNTGYNHNGGTTTTTNACVANQYTVTFNANGGMGSMASQTFTYGVAQNLTANAFTRTGYTFGGWNTAADGSGIAYADKASISNLLNNITLYAQWSQCAAGKYSENGTCVSCPKGSYCANGIKSECYSGTYADKEGMSECTACPAGSNLYKGAMYTVGGNSGATSIDSCGAASYYMPEYMVEILGFTVDEAKEQYGYDPNADANKRGAIYTICYYDAGTQQYTKNCMGIIAMCSGGYYTNVQIDPEGDQPLFETDTLSEMLDTYCMPVGTGYWSPELPHTDFENITDEELSLTWGRHACPTGLTTIGYGAGADEAGDCGRVLHVDGKKLYLRSTEKTDVSLHVKVDGVTFFGNMVVGDRKISAGADKTLKIKHNGQIYSVYDDSVN